MGKAEELYRQERIGNLRSKYRVSTKAKKAPKKKAPVDNLQQQSLLVDLKKSELIEMAQAQGFFLVNRSMTKAEIIELLEGKEE